VANTILEEVFYDKEMSNEMKMKVFLKGLLLSFAFK